MGRGSKSRGERSTRRLEGAAGDFPYLEPWCRVEFDESALSTQCMKALRALVYKNVGKMARSLALAFTT
jgi:hypothetical protein